MSTKETERIRGGIYGVAVGDALGATLEFLSRSDILQKYGTAGLRELVGGGCHELEPGQWTDDTAMTLAVAGGIGERPDAPVGPVGKRFMEWFAGKPKDVGDTVTLGLETYRELVDWPATSQHVFTILGDQAAGNGALMRILPVGLAYLEDERVVRVAVDIALMTHPHRAVIHGCALYCLMAKRLLEGFDRNESLAAATATVAGLGHIEPDPQTVEMLAGLKDKGYEDLRPTGYTVKTLEAALWCFLNAKNFEEAVVSAANLGEDADTVAAVCGGLAGVHWGIEAVPKRWRDGLLSKEKLEEAAEVITRGRNRKMEANVEGGGNRTLAQLRSGIALLC